MIRVLRVAGAAALATFLVLPASAGAVGPTPVAPPTPVVDWQTHLAHMRSMGDGAFGAHVQDCAAVHGSMGGLLGPTGTMVEMMGAMMR